MNNQAQINASKHTISFQLSDYDDKGRLEMLEMSIKYYDCPKRHSLSMLTCKLKRENGWISREFEVFGKGNGNITLEPLARKNKRRQDALFHRLEQSACRLRDIYTTMGVEAALQAGHALIKQEEAA